MANNDARQTLKIALADFDTPHLQKVLVAAYDRWTWDTGSDTDKDWYEIAEELLQERGVTITFNPANTNNTISFQMGNGTAIDVLAVNPSLDTVLGTNRSLKLTDSNIKGAMEHSLFEINNGFLDVGMDLKQAIITFLVNELESGCTQSSNSNKTLGEVIEDRSLLAVRSKL